MPIRTPGRPTGSRSTRSGRPIMLLLDLLGRRWALRVMWELRDGPLTFRQLRERCDDVSPSVLNARLRELREAGFVHLREGGGYAQTREAVELSQILLPLNDWAKGWARRRS